MVGIEELNTVYDFKGADQTQGSHLELMDYADIAADCIKKIQKVKLFLMF